MARSSVAEACGIASSSTKADINAAMIFEDRLSSLSSSFEAAQTSGCDGSAKQISLFRIRLAHVRILLYRPMLANVCFTPTCTRKDSGVQDQSLESRILQDCAATCVSNTEKLLTLVCTGSCTSGIGMHLPWWYRVFYLFVVLQHLLAAMLHPQLFTMGLYELWTNALTAMNTLEGMSPTVRYCTVRFEKMFQRVSGITRSASGFNGPVTVGPDLDFQAFFQQFGFDFQDTFFESDNAALGDNTWTN